MRNVDVSKIEHRPTWTGQVLRKVMVESWCCLRHALEMERLKPYSLSPGDLGYQKPVRKKRVVVT